MCAREHAEDCVGPIEDRWRRSVTRREALLSLAGMLAGTPLMRAQLDPRPLKDHRRAPGLDEMLTAFDFEPICFANMTLARYDFMAHGSDSEFTLRRNREAFEWVDLVRAVRDPPLRPGVAAETVNTTTNVLGLELACPILIAPSTNQRDLHPDGDAGMYQGATAAGTPMIVAGGSSIPIQKVAASADGPRWSQFYPIQNLAAAREQLELFQAAGARAIVVTVDQETSRYERDLHDRNLGGAARARDSVPRSSAPARGAGRYRVDPRRMWYSWKYLDDIRPFIKGPMLIKGLVTAADARICVERGYDGIIVSNHGAVTTTAAPTTTAPVLSVIVPLSCDRAPCATAGARATTSATTTNKSKRFMTPPPGIPIVAL